MKEIIETVPATDSQLTPPPYVSASLLGGFEQCPYKWAKAMFEGSKGDMSNARWGSEFHSVMESLKGHETAREQIEILREYFAEEAESVFDHIADIRMMDDIDGTRLLAQERQFGIEIPAVGITLNGHIDELRESDDGSTLIIRDYKTTWKWEPPVVWCNRVQPRCYNYAVRALYPDYNSYRFQIVYPRLGKDSSWELEPETATFEQYVGAIWREICRCYRAGRATGITSRGFPQTLNEYCTYCHLQDECATYQRAIRSAELPMADKFETTAEKYARLKQVADAIEAELEKTKAAIMAMIPEGKSSSEIDGHNFLVVRPNRTKYDAGALVRALHESDLGGEINFGKLFEVNNSEAEAIQKAHPELSALFVNNKKVTAGNPFIKYGGKRNI